MKKVFAFIILLLIVISGCSQQSAYEKNFEWMVKTFEENDAGFPYYLKEKGADAIEKHTSLYREKIKQAKTEKEVVALMNEWLYYFRKGHIGVFTKEQVHWNEKNHGLSDKEIDSIRVKNINRERININQLQFEKYLNENKKSLNPIEGIWQAKDFTMGIIRSNTDSLKFDAFTIKADSIYWFCGSKLAEMKWDKDSVFYETYYTRNLPRIKTKSRITGNSNNILRLEKDILKKIFPAVKYSSKDSLFIDFSLSNKPFIKKLSPKTLYLRIPSFWVDKKPLIDSLLAKNDKIIRTTQNLIIDIRNGTGGSDGSHWGLIPYYYTQPIRIAGVKYRATQLHANNLLKYGDTTMSKKIKEHIGQFFDPYNGVPFINSYIPSKLPSKIAVICNEKNASADESFLNNIKQSYKTKIFGRPTMGAFDFSNINFVDFPDGKYILWVALSASKRYPDYKIDDIGIQPDFYIDDSISEENWVDFVQSVIEK